MKGMSWKEALICWHWSAINHSRDHPISRLKMNLMLAACSLLRTSQSYRFSRQNYFFASGIFGFPGRLHSSRIRLTSAWRYSWRHIGLTASLLFNVSISWLRLAIPLIFELLRNESRLHRRDFPLLTRTIEQLRDAMDCRGSRSGNRISKYLAENAFRFSWHKISIPVNFLRLFRSLKAG